MSSGGKFPLMPVSPSVKQVVIANAIMVIIRMITK